MAAARGGGHEGYLKTMRCATSSDCQYSSGTKLVWTRKQLSVRNATVSASSGAGPPAAPAEGKAGCQGSLPRPPPPSPPRPAYRRLAARRVRRGRRTAPTGACGAAPPPASAPGPALAARRPPPSAGARLRRRRTRNPAAAPPALPSGRSSEWGRPPLCGLPVLSGEERRAWPGRCLGPRGDALPGRGAPGPLLPPLPAGRGKVPPSSAERPRGLARVPLSVSVCGCDSAAWRHVGAAAAAAGGSGRGPRRGQRALHLPARLPAARRPAAPRGHGGAAGGRRAGEEGLRESCEPRRFPWRRSPVPPCSPALRAPPSEEMAPKPVTKSERSSPAGERPSCGVCHPRPSRAASSAARPCCEAISQLKM